ARRALGPDRDDGRRIVSRRDKQQPMTENRLGNHRVAVAIAHVPDFAADLWIERVHDAGAGSDELLLAIDFDDRRRAERKFVFGVARPIEAPFLLAGLRIQSDDERIVRAVATENKQSADENRRAAVAVHGLIAVRRVFPNDFAVEVEAGRALMA